MTTERVGIIMNGVTGRMGRNQHLARSIAAIRADGGVEAGGTVIWPDPILVGRDLDRLRKLGEAHGIERFSTDLDACLADPEDQVYFDAQITSRREEAIAAAIDAGKAVYCEKPISTSSLGGLEIARRAEKAGVRNGAVQDKLFLPGLLKLGDVVASGELGRLLSVRLEFGYWVFEDDVGVGQRPSWNYRAEEGGGIVLDMFCHFRYLLDHLFGGVRSIMCTARTEVPRRVDERGKTYEVTAEDSAYALVELAGGPWPRSAPRGASGRTGTTSWSSMWTVPMEVPPPGCVSAASSLPRRRRCSFGTRTWPRRPTLGAGGSRSPTTAPPPTLSGVNGSCSCATWS